MDIDTSTKEASPMTHLQTALEASSLSKKSLQPSIPSHQDVNNVETQPTSQLDKQNAQSINELATMAESSTGTFNAEIVEETLNAEIVEETLNTEIVKEIFSAKIVEEPFSTKIVEETLNSKVVEQPLIAEIVKEAVDAEIVEETPTIANQDEEDKQNGREELSQITEQTPTVVTRNEEKDKQVEQAVVSKDMEEMPAMIAQDEEEKQMEQQKELRNMEETPFVANEREDEQKEQVNESAKMEVTPNVIIQDNQIDQQDKLDMEVTPIMIIQGKQLDQEEKLDNIQAAPNVVIQNMQIDQDEEVMNLEQTTVITQKEVDQHVEKEEESRNLEMEDSRTEEEIISRVEQVEESRNEQEEKLRNEQEEKELHIQQVEEPPSDQVEEPHGEKVVEQHNEQEQVSHSEQEVPLRVEQQEETKNDQEDALRVEKEKEQEVDTMSEVEQNIVELEVDLGATNDVEMMDESHTAAANDVNFGDVDHEVVSDWNDTNLYCSNCLKPFTTTNFYNHLTTIHNIQPEQLLSSSRFTIPGLIPKNYSPQPDSVTSAESTPFSDMKNPNNQPKFLCNKCGYQCKTRKEYWKHFSNTHKIMQGPTIVNPDILPDPDDPNFYCRTCDKTYNGDAAYTIHLRRVHRMVKDIERLLEEEYNNSTAIPDPNDPNLYCSMCQRTFSSKGTFHAHVAFVHFISIGSSGVPSFPCGVCDAVYIHEDFLRKHMLVNHGMEITSPNGNKASSSSSPSLPDRAQKFDIRILAHKQQLKQQEVGTRLQNIIGTSKLQQPQQSINKIILHPEIIPDENDPSFYCHACEKFYSSHLSLRLHIVRVHKIALKPMGIPKPIANPDVIPDIDDPNNYCAACELTFASYPSYRSHLKHKHHMELPSAMGKKRAKSFRFRSGGGRKQIPDSCRRKIFRVNSHIVPNEADPNMYCCKCDRRYDTETHYKQHLQRMHNFVFDPSRRKRTKNDDEYVHWTERRSTTTASSTSKILCQVCHSKTFRSTRDLEIHLQQAHKKILAPLTTMEDFTCKMCQKEMPSKTILANHLACVHQQKSDPGFPPKPATVSTTRNTNNTSTRNNASASNSFHHDSTDDTPPPPPPPPPKRKKTSEVIVTIEQAERVKKMKVVRKDCDICGKVFNNKYLLGAHRESMHNVLFVYDDENLYCNLCDTNYKTEHGYDNHLIDIHFMDSVSIAKETDSDNEEEFISDMSDLDEPIIQPTKSVAAASSTVAPPVQQKKKKSKPQVVKTNGVVGGTKRKRSDGRVMAPDLSNPNNTYCRACDLTYNSNSHYRLHCFKFHGIHN